MNYTPPEPACTVSPYEVNTIFWEAGHDYAGLSSHLFTESQLRSEVEKARREAIEECAAECLSQHANGNYKHDTREDCYDAIRALAASPQEQT